MPNYMLPPQVWEIWFEAVKACKYQYSDKQSLTFHNYVTSVFITLLVNDYFPEPLQLYGEGDYALANVKQMNGTEGFLGLADEVKKCQNKESVLECKANAYLANGKERCKCVPHHLMRFSITVSQFILKNRVKVVNI